MPPRAQRWQRIFEVLPGLTSWTVLLGLTVLSLLWPLAAAVVIIAFYCYWLLRLLYTAVWLGLSLLRFRLEARVNWPDRLLEVDHLDATLQGLAAVRPQVRSTKARLLHHLHERQLQRLRDSGRTPPRSEQIYQLVICPITAEPVEVVAAGVQGLLRQAFPTSRMVLLLAVEEWAPGHIKEEILALEQRHKTDFFHVVTVFHPTDLPGETMIKGANITYAARYAQQFFRRKGILPQDILVSCLDAGTVIPPDYFTTLTYFFLITPNRLRSSYRPFPAYDRHLWSLPGFARVIEAGASFFQRIEATDPNSLVSFPNYSVSLQALIDMDFCPVDMIADDSAIYWKGLLCYHGDYQVVPIPVAVPLSTVGSNDLWETGKEMYLQKQHWAAGVENFPVVARAFMTARDIPLHTRAWLLLRLFERHIAWATWGVLLGLIGWLPGLTAGEVFPPSTDYGMTPRITGLVFLLAAASLISAMLLCRCLLPPPITPVGRRQRLRRALEWSVLPVVFLCFSALPALDAQTRMMFNRRRGSPSARDNTSRP